ncbi:MAG: hypothetical protein QME71_06965 [Dehalococcoidia bacterium]|nr:hypothetical protein [Dehalococcoidia bacterium]
MRKLLALVIGTVATGWAVGRILGLDKNRPALPAIRLPGEPQAAGDARRGSAARRSPAPACEDDDAAQTPAQSEEPLPPSAVDLAPGEDVPTEPANLVFMEAFRAQRSELEAGDGLPSSLSPNENARMKSVRNEVDRRFERLSKRGRRGKRDAA